MHKKEIYTSNISCSYSIEELNDLQRWAKNVRKAYKEGRLSIEDQNNLDAVNFIYDEKLAKLRSVFKSEDELLVIAKNEVV